MTMTATPEQEASQRENGYPVDPAKLVTLRHARVWSRSELAQQAGLSLAAITKIENGERTPRAETLRALCKALGCEPADLLA